MRELLHTKHYVVTIDEDAKVIRRVRSAQQFESLSQLETEYAELARAMDRLDRIRYAVLVDVRSAPPRNDPEFEAAVERHHEALYRGFRAAAVLVQSAVGKLQVRRMFEESRVKMRVFSDESEAMLYLTGSVTS